MGWGGGGLDRVVDGRARVFPLDNAAVSRVRLHSQHTILVLLQRACDDGGMDTRSVLSLTSDPSPVAEHAGVYGAEWSGEDDAMSQSKNMLLSQSFGSDSADAPRPTPCTHVLVRLYRLSFSPTEVCKGSFQIASVTWAFCH